MKKFRTPKALESAWKDYKIYCDSKTVTTHRFNPKSGEFVSVDVKHPISYTIDGFCVFIGISRAAFYKTYDDNPQFTDIVEQIKTECEVDARTKFEQGTIPSQLAGLWMSKYGYSVKSYTSVSGTVPVVISGAGELED